jgi:hypothetical protein
MKNLAIFAVALATGLTSFAAYAKDTSIASLESKVASNKTDADEAAAGVDVIKTSSIGAAGKSQKVGKATTDPTLAARPARSG